mmetsp:Transcript_29816/g.50361  ORF Transcript_29816/g.50361 Transcript_29816/m.50361 type:complete len:233 (-) Transcript_29816:1091-1789(-)
MKSPVLIYTLLVHVTRLAFGSLSAGCGDDPAALWSAWLTGRQDISYWDNMQQINNETHQQQNDVHPYSLETRWNLQPIVQHAPDSWQFVLEEIGTTAECGYDCSPMMFGVMAPDEESCNLQLYSYDMYNDYMKSIVNCLHENSNNYTSMCVIDYEKLTPDGFEIAYTFGYNDTYQSLTFDGYGAGQISSKLYMTISESIASSFSAVLELMYNNHGHLITPYDTPIIYESATP